jgi:hypothetical protein
VLAVVILLMSGSTLAIGLLPTYAAIGAVYVCAAVAAGVELFATRVRYSGFSIGYNICVATFGGTTPYVVSWLTAQTANSVAPASPGRSGRNVPIRGRCSPGGENRVATELQLGRAAAIQSRDAAQVDITRRCDTQPHRPCRRRADACAGRRGNDHRRRARGQRDE